jgi:hypothetical protein
MSIVHLHLMLNHVPVIGMAFVLFLLAAAMLRRNDGMGRLGLAVMTALAAVTAIVFLTGEPAEEAIEGVVSVSEAVIHPHEEAAEVALIATGIAGTLALLALVVYWRRAIPRWVNGAAFAMALLTSGMLGWTANLGGQIRHTEIGAIGSETVGDLDDRRH